MRQLAFLLFLLVATQAAAQSGNQAGGPTASESEPPALQVMYACPGGTDFEAVFSKDGDLATLSVPGQPEIELSRQRSGTGFLYSDSYYDLRGRGREATLTAAGRSMRCHAVGQPGEPPRTYQGGGLTITLLPDGLFRLRDSTAGGTPLLDLGQWAQEVDGGVRLVLRGGTVARRVFREDKGDRLIAENGSVLARTDASDPIDGTFPMAGLYRDTQAGGVFAECLTGRTFMVAPGGAEPDLERAWTEATPSNTAQLYVEILGRFVSGEISAERFLTLKRNGACPPLAPRGSALRGTEWRVTEIDGEKPAFDDWRQRPQLTLEDDGKYSGATGCNAISGTYELDVDGLRFKAPAGTLAACAPALAVSQQRFLDALSTIREAQIAGTTLDLTDGTASGACAWRRGGR